MYFPVRRDIERPSHQWQSFSYMNIYTYLYRCTCVYICISAYTQVNKYIYTPTCLHVYMKITYIYPGSKRYWYLRIKYIHVPGSEEILGNQRIRNQIPQIRIHVFLYLYTHAYEYIYTYIHICKHQDVFISAYAVYVYIPWFEGILGNQGIRNKILPMSLFSSCGSWQNSVRNIC